MTALLTADWYPFVDNRYFRKWEAYRMAWNPGVVDNAAVLIPAKFGGPIAVVRDRMKMTSEGLKPMGKPSIEIYNASGCSISKFMWNSGTLVQAGWSHDERLLCVQKNGKVLIYSMFGTYVHSFSMGQEVEDTGACDAVIFAGEQSTGICVLTGARRIFLTYDVNDVKIRKYCEIPGSSTDPNCWNVVLDDDGKARVLLAKTSGLYYASEMQVTQKNILNGSEILKMAVSPDFKRVALYSSQKQLWIGSYDLRSNTRIFNVPGKPSQIQWCGSDGVALFLETTLMIAGVVEDAITYFYDGPIAMCSEIDCVRVITPYATDLIQAVPQVLADIYRINSTSASSYLLEASKQFQRKNHRANEYMQVVRSDTTEFLKAIDDCVEAAGHEFSPENQKMLLQAAQFGKTFARDYDSDGYVHICRLLRVLNAVRNEKVGIFITYEQLKLSGAQNLLDRLIRRRHYFLAVQAANYMRISNEQGSTRILEHWAYYKVSQLEAGKENIAEEIFRRLGYNSGVSYCVIAKKAIKCGRKKLAVELLEYEPRASLQVSLLLQLEKYGEAMKKALSSGDGDLIGNVIVKMKRKITAGDFELELSRNPYVYALYKKYCCENDIEASMSISKQVGDYAGMAACHLKNAYNPENFSKKASFLEAAKDSFKKSRDDFSAQQCENERRLLTQRKELKEKYGRIMDSVGHSFQDTICELLDADEVKAAEELKTSFKMREERFWRLRIESMAKFHKWKELEAFSKSKKSPIGYEPFADICVQYGVLEEGKKYVTRLKEDNKISYLVKLKMYTEACRIAESQRNAEALKFIYDNCDGESKTDVMAAITRATTRS